MARKSSRSQNQQTALLEYPLSLKLSNVKKQKYDQFFSGTNGKFLYYPNLCTEVLTWI